jgi:hypothetical protein
LRKSIRYTAFDEIKSGEPQLVKHHCCYQLSEFILLMFLQMRWLYNRQGIFTILIIHAALFSLPNFPHSFLQKSKEGIMLDSVERQRWRCPLIAEEWPCDYIISPGVEGVGEDAFLWF